MCKLFHEFKSKFVVEQFKDSHAHTTYASTALANRKLFYF
jgi:hypothetical protein